MSIRGWRQAYLFRNVNIRYPRHGLAYSILFASFLQPSPRFLPSHLDNPLLFPCSYSPVSSFLLEMAPVGFHRLQSAREISVLTRACIGDFRSVASGWAELFTAAATVVASLPGRALGVFGPGGVCSRKPCGAKRPFLASSSQAIASSVHRFILVWISLVCSMRNLVCHLSRASTRRRNYLNQTPAYL